MSKCEIQIDKVRFRNKSCHCGWRHIKYNLGTSTNKYAAYLRQNHRAGQYLFTVWNIFLTSFDMTVRVTSSHVVTDWLIQYTYRHCNRCNVNLFIKDDIITFELHKVTLKITYIICLLHFETQSLSKSLLLFGNLAENLIILSLNV